MKKFTKTLNRLAVAFIKMQLEAARRESGGSVTHWPKIKISNINRF